VPGFYYFKNLYTLDGILYAVTDDPSSIPKASWVMSDPREADGNFYAGTENRSVFHALHRSPWHP
jgi:hypothetical protein